jgi:thioredoxin-related protein
MKRRNLLIVSFALAFLAAACSTQAESGAIKWYGYSDGLSAAKKEKKKIFLYFHADWCAYCRKMQQTTFTDKAVAAYLNEHFIPIRVNTDKEPKLTRDYGIRPLPANFFLTEGSETISLPWKSGVTLNYVPGYLPGEMFLHLIRFVETEGYLTGTFQQYMDKQQTAQQAAH